MKLRKRPDNRVSVYIFLGLLMAAMTLFIAGCGDKNGASGTEKKTEAQSDTMAEKDDLGSGGILGEGNRKFPFSVVDKDGNETIFEIHTDRETVGEALKELGLIDGEESEYGLYVKTVNGITADYDTDGVYWAFYVNGEYALSGVDTTQITDGDSYSFKIEKG